MDILDHVTSYAGPNAALKLLLTGDSALAYKLRRSGHLSLCWESSSYADWNASKPLINRFPHLQALTLTYFSPDLLTKGRLDGTMFPSTLTYLKLAFNGVFAALATMDGHAPTLFSNCNQLLHLHLHDDITATTIDLKHFPKTLRTLVLKASSTLRRATFELDDLSHLPQDLEKLHLNIVAHWPSTGQPTINIGENIPYNLSSLTDLSVWIALPGSLRTDLVGAHLKRLEVISAQALTRHGTHLNVFENGDIAQCYPVLESLHCNQAVLWNAERIQTLPPSLTELVVAAHWSQSSDYPKAPENLALLAKAGLNIRWLDNYKNDVPMDTETLSCFPNLEYLGMRVSVSDVGTAGPQLLPQRLTQLSAGTLSITQLLMLPTTLTKLRVSDITANADEKQLLSTLEPNTLLKGLATLFCVSYLPIEVALNLPSALESIALLEGSCAALTAITRRSNAGDFPRLTSLSVTTPFKYENPMKPHPQFGDPWELTNAVVPRTITSLRVSGFVRLSNRDELSLKHLPKLTYLDLLDETEPMDLLLQLPAGLRTLRAKLGAPVDLGDHRKCLEFSKLRTRLPFLKEINFMQQFAMFVPPTPRTFHLSFCEFYALPWSIKAFYLKSLVRMRLGQETARWEDAHVFGVSCLPRNLSTLIMPFNLPSGDRLTDTKATPTLRRFLIAVFKYHFPLLALPLTSALKMNPQREALLEAMPPHLSGISSGTESHKLIPFERRTGFDQNDLYKSWRATSYVIEPTFHAMNVLSWLACVSVFPKRLFENRLLKAYAWNSVIGSSLSFGLLLWRIYRKGLLAPHHLSAVAIPFQRSAALLAVFTPLVAILPCIVPKSKSYWSYARIPLLTFYVIFSSVRNYLVFAVAGNSLRPSV